jgi:hypothetical protein
MKNWIFKDEPASPPDPKVARTRAMLLSLPFAIVGILALVFLLHDEVGSGFRMKKQMAMGLLSAAIVCGGLIALIFGITAKKQALNTGSPKISDDEKPWLKRTDWAAGRIASGTRKSVLLLWLFTLIWNAVSAPIVFIGLPLELHKGNYGILVALLFPVVGIGMILYALKTTLAWRRFGQSIFEMAAIPATPGGTLEGQIQVKTKLQPQHGLHLRLSCIRQTTTGSGKGRHTNEKILWQDEKWLRPDLPQIDLNATGIPIFFKLPADQPESIVGSGDGIHWRLEASAKLRGPNFHTTFDVPVFKLEETPAVAEDPTAQYQMSLDEVRQQIHSKIQVNDLPDGGKEFVFPAARNPGVATGLTLIWLIFTGVVVVLFCYRKEVPVVFPLILGFLDLGLTKVLSDLWFLRRCVVVTPEHVTVKTSSLIFKKERVVAAADIAGFDAEQGMTVGHSAYYDLKIRVGGPSGITAAANIGNKPEADWLAQQMAAVFKRPA